MNRTEILKLLTFAAALDRRTVGETDVTAWHLVLGPLDYERAQAAIITHFRKSTEYLTPAHIWHLAKTGTDGEAASARDVSDGQVCDQGTLCRRCKSVHQPDERCTVLQMFGPTAQQAIAAGVTRPVPARYGTTATTAADVAPPDLTGEQAAAQEAERARQLAQLEAMPGFVQSTSEAS